MTTPQPLTEDDFLVCIVCGTDICCCEASPCPDCDNGTIVTCWDDLCHTGDGCMHGDGESTCGTCNGEGEVYPERVTEEEYRKSKEVKQ